MDFSSVIISFKSSQQCYKILIIIHILQMRKQRHWEVEQIPGGSITNGWQKGLASRTSTFRTYISNYEVTMLVTQSCLTLCNPMDCSPPGSSVHVILQARILERVDISSSRGNSQPRDQTQVSCIAGRFFTTWATREAQLYHYTKVVGEAFCKALFSILWWFLLLKTFWWYPLS